MIFIDSNVPMYLVGADHPLKVEAERWLLRLSMDREALVTDAEVLQEILHRYRAVDRSEAIQPAFDVLLALVDRVLPIDEDTVLRAKDELLARWNLSARDALHVAVMREHRVGRILSFDRGFDQVPDLERIGG